MVVARLLELGILMAKAVAFVTVGLLLGYVIANAVGGTP